MKDSGSPEGAMRSKWPNGFIGLLCFVTDHLIYRLDSPIDWPAAAVAEIVGIDGAIGYPSKVSMTNDRNGADSFLVSRLNLRVVIGMLWVAIVCAIGILAYLANNVYRETSSRLQDDAASYAHLIASHVRYDFTIADVLLKNTIDSLTWADFNGAAPFSPKHHQAVLDILERNRQRLPGIASYTIIGADGIRRGGVAGEDYTNLSDRGYFKALARGQDLFISNAEPGLASGKPGIHVARRFSGPHGEFGGVIAANLTVDDVFIPFYKSLRFGHGYDTGLRDSQRILIRYPSNSPTIDEAAGHDKIEQDIKLGVDHETFIEDDPATGAEKLTAFERLGGSEIYATVSVPVAEAMQEPRMVAMICAIASLAFVITGFAVTIALRRTIALEKARAEAVKAIDAKRRLINRINVIIEDERKSIANEIHDDLNASLIAVRLDSQHIISLTDELKSDAVICEVFNRAQCIFNTTKDLYASGRDIVRRLRPEMIDVLGLLPAIQEMVRNYDSVHPSCRFSIECDCDAIALQGDSTIAAYRIVQEAIANAVKHAGATNVTVRIGTKNHAEWVDIVITDNGKGFDARQPSSGIGIVGMQERVLAFGGTIKINSVPGRGTEVRISLPLAQESALAKFDAE